MNRCFSWNLVLCVLVLACAAGAAGRAGAAPPAPASCAPALELAAEALAGGRLDIASAEFDRLSRDASLPPFVRSLASLGLAETALARGDGAAADLTWRQVAEDPALPQLHRDIASRRRAEEQRRRNGLSARDPHAYRAKLPVLPAPAVTLHVATGAVADGDGSPGKPLPSLQKARDAVRALKRGNNGTLPAGGVCILVQGGLYRVDETLQLSGEDSGTPEAPMIYRAADGESPVLTGGVRLTGWTPLADATLRERLDPAVRDRLLCVDVKAHGVTDLGDATALRNRPELFCDGVPQTLARWPNEGFVHTGEVLGAEKLELWGRIAGCRDGKFRYLEDRAARWADEPDARLYGYWFWDWYEEYQKVASIDRQERTITLDRPWSSYGYRKGQRYHALNLFCEIDTPGEWYLDRRSGLLYWLTPEGFDPQRSAVTVSMTSRPFISIDGASHIIVQGLALQDGRGDGIHLRGGSDCLIVGCTVRRLGGDAIVVQGGVRHGVFGCVLHTLGCGGMRIAGGDLKSLTPGHHFAENCTVYDISRLKRTYTPAVHLDGCGNRVAHNLFERIPSSAMRIEGNDHVVELNRVRHVVQESDDQGGIDMFGNPLYRGVVLRWNHWLDITGGTECGAAGIRLDDMISGIAVYGNIFERCGAHLFGGVQIHGGKENLVDNNLFVDCHAGVSFSRWGEKRWLEAITRFLEQAGSPPYAARYPALAGLREKADVNYITRSVYAGCRSIYLRDGGVSRSALAGTLGESVDPAQFLAADSMRPIRTRSLFEPIPLEEIGPYAHPWRATPGQY